MFHAVARMSRVQRKQVSSGGPGQSPDSVFPLPPMTMGDSVVRGSISSSLESSLLFHGGNFVLDVLNWLHGGGEVCEVISAAHKRVHARVGQGLLAQVMTDEPTLTPHGVDQFLRQTQNYTGTGVVLALRVRGGVPEAAADVPLASHVREHFPSMAGQVLDPSMLLLPSHRRPKRVKRGYTWLSSTYPQLVKRNLKAGLHRLKKPSQVARHRGVKCLAGAFAVAKDEVEDRVITDPSVNQLLDPDKLPRPKFAYIPKLRTVSVPKDGTILVFPREMQDIISIVCRLVASGSAGFVDQHWSCRSKLGAPHWRIQQHVQPLWVLGLLPDGPRGLPTPSQKMLIFLILTVFIPILLCLLRFPSGVLSLTMYGL